jgi:hypothetical protein
MEKSLRMIIIFIIQESNLIYLIFIYVIQQGPERNIIHQSEVALEEYNEEDIAVECCEREIEFEKAKENLKGI